MSEPKTILASTHRFEISLSLLLSCLCLASTASAQVQVDETDSAITVSCDERVVVGYVKVSPPAPSGIDSVYERSGCLHPVKSPRGRTVTQMFPLDHPHQHGVFSAWVNTTFAGEAVDFWNLAGGTGRVRHDRVVSTFQQPETAGFEVDLIHRATKAGVDVLRERWKVTVYQTDDTYHCFDLESTQTALTELPLTVNEYHYGGMALRGPTSWLAKEDRQARDPAKVVSKPCEFLNDLGSRRGEGNHEHAKWVAMSGSLDGGPVTIAVLSHRDNFRAPQAARIHPTKPYFCFAPCVDGSFTIDRENPYRARYRYLITDTPPRADWIDEQWRTWCGK